MSILTSRSVNVRVDNRIISALNVAGAFRVKVNNNGNIGLSTEEIVGLWNEEHPDRLIEMEPAPAG